MTKTMNMDQKAHSGKAKKNSPPLNGRSALFSSDHTGTIGTKRQTYHIQVDLIAKLRGYAYWEQQQISAVINRALEQFFEDKEVKLRPPKNASLKKKR